MMEGQTKRIAPRRRRIVPRPRLTSKLDASSARVRLLIGSAGYGKTTLAEQWTSQAGRLVAWYRVGDAAVDVAVLGVGLAEVSEGVVPGCVRRIRARTMVSTNPRDETELLAEMLAEDLAGWPAHAWLVLDDYHALCPAPEAELFVETLVRRAPVNVLVTSRCRPSWVSSRNILYGEVFELSQTTLAMTQEEAEAVLDGWNAEHASGLIALAEGWPAVVGLAGILPLPADPGEEVPGALYDFFAEEVFQTLEAEVRQGLATLAVAPALDRELVRRMLGAEPAEHVVDEGLRTGILDERGAALELHPLARTFLDSAGAAPDGPRMAAVSECLAAYRERRDWDAVFALIEKNRLVVQLESLVGGALDELLTGSRIATLERWVAAAEKEGSRSAIFRLARAELLLRQGEHLAASTLASAACNQNTTSPEDAFRGAIIMATAAHVAGDEAKAADLFAGARKRAVTPHDERRAEWGRLMCLTELELDEARTVLDALSSSLHRDDPCEVVLEAGRRLGLELKFGSIQSLSHARAATSLLPYVVDPIVRASFRSVMSWSLALIADYQPALAMALEMIRDAEDHRIHYALPYAHTAAAAAFAGLRDYEASLHELQRAEELASSPTNEHAEANAIALRIRVLMQAQRVSDACRLPMPARDPSHTALAGELHASRSLALAVCGHVDEAATLLRRVRDTTRCIEVRALSPTVDAIIALKARLPGLSQALRLAVEESVASGGHDLLVTAYRSCPELLAALIHDETTLDLVWPIMVRSGDSAAVEATVGSHRNPDGRVRLSPREMEVCELACNGLTNRQIGEILFISEKTVKVHLEHIYDKTGVRSRRALAISRYRASQAAPSATAGSDAGLSDTSEPS